MAGLSLSLVLAAVVAGWVVWRDQAYVAPPPQSPSSAIRPGEAAAVLQQLEQAVRDADPAAASGLAPAGDPAAAARLTALVRNAQNIDVGDFSLRYVDSVGGMDGSGRWAATVETGWRFMGFDRTTAVADVEITFDADRSGTGIAAIGGDSGRTPVWMSGRVDVHRDRRALVVAASGARRYAALARRAVPVVTEVLPRWRDGLVVEVPADGAALDAALGADPGQYAAIAAVTSGAGDELGPRSPVHVFVNPEVFRTLEPVGAQVVMSHEAVHVATDAATEPDSVPAWLTEGYADYVALREVDLPLSVTAAQVIRQVRRQGPPRQLPGESEFDTRTGHLGAAYEAAWLACRLLAAETGPQRLTRFYTGLDEGDDFAAAFRQTFGFTVATFTRRWRSHLRDVAA